MVRFGLARRVAIAAALLLGALLAAGPALAQTEAKPLNRAGWVTSNDYPARSLRAEEEGRTVVAILVSREGRAQACLIVDSSGFSALDEATCTQVMRRGRFSPATDAAGNPRIGCHADRIAWNLDTLEPPTAASDEALKNACAIARLRNTEWAALLDAPGVASPQNLPPPIQTAAARPAGGAPSTAADDFDDPFAPTIVQVEVIAATGPRVALLIGNSNYGANLGRLPNPVNDVTLIGDALRRAGFDVEVVKDADQKTMKRAISRLGERMGTAGRGATGFFFFAGHGVQSKGVNYLIPVGAPIEREADLDLEAVAASTVLAQMEEAGVSTNLIVLDACRNMPLARSFRDGSRGLARMEAPNGSFIAYSTAPGSVAADGGGSNSPFAEALASEMLKPGQPIETMFRQVRRRVYENTEGRQVPWDSSSLIESFSFVPEG